MTRGRPLILCCVAMTSLLALAIDAARARTTIVPDDFPTIQAAVDAMPENAPVETLLVRGGSYPERVRVDRNLVVIGIPSLDGSDLMPEIGGLAAGGDGGGSLAFVGLRFTGHAYDTSYSPDNLIFIDCRFDADFGPSSFPGLGVDTNSLHFTRCTFLGTTVVASWIATLDSCTAFGPVTVAGIDHARVLDTRFENIPGRALFIAYSRDAVVARNRVRGCRNAFEASTDEGMVRFEDNDIEDCVGWGILSYGNEQEATFLVRNRVSRCGSFGIRASGAVTALENFVVECGAAGIEIGQTEGTAVVEGNVIGRCVGVGMGLAGYDWQDQAPNLDVRRNTVYACGGPAISIANLPGSTIANNIFYECLELSVSSSEPLAMSNNDWFPLNGAPVSATDVSVDPSFCDVANNDVRLMSDSPLLDLPGVGRIGALGQGCEAPIVAMGLQMWPRVLQPAAVGRRVTATLEPPAPFAVADIDVASVLVNGVALAGVDGIVGDRDKDGIPDLQLQFDRASLERAVAPGEDVEVVITGRIGRRNFSGADRIRVLRYAGGPRSEIPRNAAREYVLSIRAPLSGAASAAQVEFTLVDESPANLNVIDVAGRVVLSRAVGSRGPGEHTLDLGGDNGLSQGIYFLRLRQGTTEARTRWVVVR